MPAANSRKGGDYRLGILFRPKDKTYPEGLSQDTLLAFRAADGDTDAFEALVRAHEKLVSTCVYSVVGNTEDTLDISQEVFLKVYRNLSAFKGDSEFSTWLFRIAKNCAYDFVRKKKLPTASIDSSGEENEGFDIPDMGANPEEKLLADEKKEKLHRAIDSLSPEHREIIILRDINDYSYEQIADMLSLEVGTVKSRIFRAREALRKFLLKENYF